MKDLTLEQARHRMYEEGFTYVSAWQDEPGLDYGTHTHRDRVGVFLLAGSMEFTFGSRRLILRGGSRLDLPPNTAHGTKVGPKGALYVLGEMIVGDAELTPLPPPRRLLRTQDIWN